MTDTWTVTRAGTGAWNGEAGNYGGVPTTVYTGVGKLQSFESYEQSPTVAGHGATVMRPVLHLPVNDASAAIRVDDVATRTACPTDAALVGTVVTIKGAPSGNKTAATARRFPVEEAIA